MATNTFTWVLSEIVSRFREHVGLSDTTSLATATIEKWINDYYQNYFPEEANVDLLHGFHTQSTAPTDTGRYSVGQTVLRLNPPFLWKHGDYESEIPLTMDRDKFFSGHPESEDYVTTPSLAIGSSDTAAVATGAFTYEINGYSYSKAAAETSFSGLSTVPQNKYGAFSLTIDEDGTITINEADDNSTGYDTIQEAIEGLADASSDEAYLGYVTVISTDAGGFVPGTTALSASAVTDTYTDGWPGNRGQPEEACIYAGYLYIRPRPDDIYQLRAPKISRPDALDTDDDDAPLDIQWGPCIACGAAILYIKIVQKDEDRAKELLPVFNYYLGKIKDKDILQVTRSPIPRSF